MMAIKPELEEDDLLSTENNMGGISTSSASSRRTSNAASGKSKVSLFYMLLVVEGPCLFHLLSQSKYHCCTWN